MKKFTEILLIVAFSLVLLFVGTFTILKEKDTVAEFENRNLAVIPAYTTSSLLDGSYFDQWELYFTDHACARKTLLKADIWADINVFRRPVVNDIVITEDKLLSYQSFQDYGDDYIITNSEKTADAMAEVADYVRSYGGTFLFVAVPAKYDYLAEDYPSYLNNKTAYTDKECDYFYSCLEDRDISYLDIGDVWAKEGNPANYMSTVDHHFTWDGAFSAYRGIMAELNALTGYDLQIYSQEDYDVTALPNPYLGSAMRKIWGLWDSDEAVCYGELKNPVPFTRWNSGTLVDSEVFSLPYNDTEYVTYGVYMGGDLAETLIDTERPELPDLLIYGDSFTNAEETLLYASFNTMTSLDFRYYDAMTLLEYVKIHQPDIVLGLRDYEAMYIPVDNGLSTMDGVQ